MTTTSNFMSTLSALTPPIGSLLESAPRIAIFSSLLLTQRLRSVRLPLGQNHDSESIGRTYRPSPEYRLDIWTQGGAHFIPEGPIPRYCQYHRAIDSPEHLGCNPSITSRLWHNRFRVRANSALAL